ncbi:MAG: Uma2 family endonuclease [Fimbriiglobus sp.]
MSERPNDLRFTVLQFLKLMETGILPQTEKLELVRGRIVHKMPKNPPHEFVLVYLMGWLCAVCPEEFIVRCQVTLELPDSLVDPDLAIVRGPRGLYRESHPTGKDATLVVEVSDTSLAQDLGDKLTAYALAKIPEYWVVDIPLRQIHVFTKPKGGKKPGYKSQVTYSDVDSVPVLDVGELKVSEVLP